MPYTVLIADADPSALEATATVVSAAGYLEDGVFVRRNEETTGPLRS